MHALSSRWSKFKQESISILTLSIIQIWWSFNFPIFLQLGTPLYEVLAIVTSIIGVITITYLLSFADKYASRFNLEYLDNMPYASVLKNVEKVALLIMTSAIMFFIWFSDFYGMSNTHYIIQYMYCISLFICVYRAANRWPSD